MERVYDKRKLTTKKKVLKNKNFRRNVLNEILDKSKNKLFIGNWRKVNLLKTKIPALKKFEGENIHDIARYFKSKPIDWLFDHTIEGGINDLFTAELLNSDEDEVKKLLTHKYSTITLSDAGAHSSLLCDAGYALDLLGKWTREKKVFSLEDAVHNLTGKQADICRIPKRGRLVPGYYADMILFDPDKIGTTKTYRAKDLPAQSERLKVDPIGIREIWVNGLNINKGYSGKLIRAFLS